MKVLVTGAAGLLGSNLCTRLTMVGHDVVGFYHDLGVWAGDVTWKHYTGNLLSGSQVSDVLSLHKPDAVINCVGLTDVDMCEERFAKAWEVNALSVMWLARYTFLLGIRLIHISTDHLFDGKLGNVTEETPPNPVNVYGRSKWAGERMCLFENPTALVLRTTFYGWGPEGHKPTYADWLYANLRDGKPIKLFDDYFFNPLEVGQLSDIINKLLSTKINGVLNACGSQTVSKAVFGFELARVFGFDTSNAQVTSLVQGNTKAPRPTSLSMSVNKLISLGIIPGSIKEGLAHLYNTMKKEK